MAFDFKKECGQGVETVEIIQATTEHFRDVRRITRETEYHTIQTENGDFLCYDVMEMKQSEANPCKVGVQGSQG